MRYFLLESESKGDQAYEEADKIAAKMIEWLEDDE